MFFLFDRAHAHTQWKKIKFINLFALFREKSGRIRLIYCSAAIYMKTAYSKIHVGKQILIGVSARPIQKSKKTQDQRKFGERAGKLGMYDQEHNSLFIEPLWFECVCYCEIPWQKFNFGWFEFAVFSKIRMNEEKNNCSAYTAHTRVQFW